MLTKKYRSSLALFLLVAILPAACNKNRKYVKGEVIGVEDLCHLGRFVPVGERDTEAVEGLNLMPPAETLGDKETNKPRAVVHGLERRLLGNGAHREVRSEVAVELQDLGIDGGEMSVTDDCALILLESLSNGVFADPFQLNRLQQQNAVKYAQIYGDADLERPAKNSFRSIVELHQRLVPDTRTGLEVLYRSEVTLPLHARYPPVSAESHFLVNITMPHVLVHCGSRGDHLSGTKTELKQELCLFAVLEEVLPTTLQWPGPSGYPAHSVWVSRLTSLSALGAVAAIFIASKVSAVK